MIVKKKKRSGKTELLVKGNAKLGKSIWCFSIPAGFACPGKSTLCSERCYAQKGFFCMPNVQAAQMKNYEATLLDDFVERMVENIRKAKAHVIRIHVAGDFYSADYVNKWREIVLACPDVKFFAYTRSWHLPVIREALDRYVRDCKNLRMFFSYDASMDVPTGYSKRVKLAYMAVHETDIPANKEGIVFRDYGVRDKTIARRINGVTVCPVENGLPQFKDFTCERCGLCWDRDKIPMGPADSGATQARKRFALTLVA